MINIERLKLRMDEMANVGAGKDGAVTRLALSLEDKQARELLIIWMKNLNLSIKIDDFGNIYGRKEGSNPKLSPVMLGSHIDSVPEGGKFDGVLGVLGALEALETFIVTNKQHDRSIEIIAFTNEEGARFTPQMLGSGAVTDIFTRNYVYNRTDKDELRFEDELRKINFLGEKKNRPSNIHSFIELHIEQGPILETTNTSIGIVEGIAGFSWLEIDVIGESNHSGTTPMTARADSLVAATFLIQKLHTWVNEKRNNTVLTVGKINAVPGSINVIPQQTTFTVDVRIHDEKEFDFYLKEIKQIIDQTIVDYGLKYNINEIRTQKPVPFSKNLITLLENICNEKELSYKKMKSGAGHDAMYMKNITETVMIFVPSVNGKSHSVEEYTEWRDIQNGVNTLYEMLKTIS